MERPPHDYTAMSFAQQQQQQQQQYGFHPQHQQFPPHGPPFMAPHPSMQQYPFPRHLPPQQLHPHHILHLQQQQPPIGSFPPHHVPPHMVPPPHFHHPFDAMPPPAPAPPPLDPELHKRIDKLAEYAAKNGPEFEAMIREKQRDNLEYAFLFGGDGHGYYRYKLWLITHAPDAAFGAGFGSSSVPLMPPINQMMNSSSLSPAHLSASPVGHLGSIMGGPQLHQSYPPSYEQHQLTPHGLPYMGLGRGDYDTPPPRPFKGLAGPLPSDVSAELNDVLSNLTGTKESIKGAKLWFMQRSPFAPALAEALRETVFRLDDSEKQLHIVFLANDILFDSLQRRVHVSELDNEALAFKPVLGSMLARIYNNPHNKDANQSRLEKILQFWAAKEVYDLDTIQSLEKEMTGGAPLYHSSDASHSLDASGSKQAAWQSDMHRNSIHGSTDQEPPEKPSRFGPPVTANAFPGSAFLLANAVPSSDIQSTVQAALQSSLPHLPITPAAGVGDQQKLPPYPLFPPGLIPGMVRKMQIGSGVPYSPLSPLDIPTVIPPSNVTPSEVLDRVSKFFREIGEVNPSEGPMKSSDSAGVHDDYEHDEYDRELSVRKGGACIPPPPNLQVDQETGMYPDGTVERKPGSSSTGRLGLGARADPNEVTQYDDVYNSYRKQRSTSYHTSMSARTTTK